MFSLFEKKMILRKFFIVFLLFALFLSSQNIFLGYSSGEFDKIATVEWVIDGDTFRTDENEKVRLADINTPEENAPGYWEATNYMISTVKNKVVFLDIDDKYIYDDQGDGTRLVSVVYVDYNQTHYLNVNKALLENDLAVIWEHDNEFNPYTWTLFVSKNSIPEFSSLVVVPIFIIMSAVILISRNFLRKNC